MGFQLAQQEGKSRVFRPLLSLQVVHISPEVMGHQGWKNEPFLSTSGQATAGLEPRKVWVLSYVS